MSRIDEALKRLAGAAAPDIRNTSTLDRFTAEGKRPTEAKIPARVDDRKVSSLAAIGPRPVEPTAPKQLLVTPPVGRNAAGPEDSEADEESIIEIKPLVAYAGFLGRSLHRHRVLAIATVAVVMVLTAATLAVLPRTYHIQTTLLAQRNALMTALSNPGRAVPWDADAPTRAAAETVLKRDNLIALIKRTDLVNEWERTRAPILKLKDWFVATVTRYTPTPEDKLDVVIAALEDRMKVEAGPVGDGTVTIDLLWPDGEMGSRLVQDAQEAFVEARQAAETAAIGESIAILERYSASLNEGIRTRIADLHRAEAKASPVARRVPQPASPPIANATTGPPLDSPVPDQIEADTELGRLKTLLTSKRQELARLDEARQRQRAEAEAKLAQLRTIYTRNHPSVASAEQTFSDLTQETPQAFTLASEIEGLQEEYDELQRDATAQEINTELQRRTAQGVTAGRVTRAGEEVAIPAAPAPASTQMREYASLSLRSELRQLESVLERTDAARIELAVSQAAFKYRYSVIRPAQAPRDPEFPKANLILTMGLITSLFLAACVVVAKDLLSDRILEPWQIERQLGLPVLGVLRVG